MNVLNDLCWEVRRLECYGTKLWSWRDTLPCTEEIPAVFLTMELVESQSEEEVVHSLQGLWNNTDD